MNNTEHPRYGEIVTHINSYVEVLNQMHQTEEKLIGLPLEIDCGAIYEEILNYHEERLRIVLGMPKEDEIGHFVFDYYVDALHELLEGNRSLSDTVSEFVQWRNR